MGFVTTMKGSRAIQLLTLTIGLVITYFLFRSGSGSFSVEEVNSLLQNKDESIVSIKKVELTAQALSTPYFEGTSFELKNYDIAGNTLIKNNEYIRLTSDISHQAGNIFSKFPIQAESFEMEVTFHIHSKSNLQADGFAIWFIDEKSDIGTVFGAQDLFNGLGIFIDTFRNGQRGQFPFVNVMLGDGKTSYDKNTDGSETRIAGCIAKSVLNPSSGQTKVRIIYMKNGYFSLDINYSGKHEDWSNCVSLNDLILPPVKYLGFSAETGELSENVDVIENKIYALYNPEGGFISSVEELEHIIEDQEEYKVKVPETNRRGRRRKRANRRKSVSRLKAAEKRIKDKEKKYRLEKYGDENAHFFNRFWKFIVTLVKISFWIGLSVVVCWLLYVAYRSSKRNSRKPRGLLD